MVKRLPDQIMCGQTYGQKLVKPPAQNREQQEWRNEKPKLDNARRLKGIYFIDPDDEECIGNSQNTRGEDWKELWHQQCLAKGKLKQAPRKWLQSMKLHPKRFTKKRFMAEKWNLTNPQGKEWNLLYPQKNEDHIPGNCFTSMTHYILVHKFIPKPQAM